MLRRIPLAILLAIQAVAGGAITLAHARDVAVAPAAIEASHDARCAILHDELRCALCHYANTRVLQQHTFTLPSVAILQLTVAAPLAHPTVIFPLTLPARAPPSSLS
ncbi:MAG: hypothetical protein ABR537_09620 [Gemmatimonadales bacterium]